MDTPKAPAEEPIWSLLPFWFVAFAAAGMFAAVTIAPGLDQETQLTARVHQLADDCRELAEANHYLDRVVDALQHDPEFTAELARAELDYGVPGEQRLPAPVPPKKQPSPHRPERAATARSNPVLRLFAHDWLVRHTALLTAAACTVVAFTFFNRTHEPERRNRPSR